MYHLLVRFLVLFLCAAKLSVASSEFIVDETTFFPSTPPITDLFDEDEKEKENINSGLPDHIYERLSKSKYNVRTQIKKSLEPSIAPHYWEDSLKFPVFCVGTGRSWMGILFSSDHYIPTIVEEQDTTLDLNKRIKPHFNERAWDIGDTSSILKRRGDYGSVFFAHVGYGIDSEEPTKKALRMYFDLLKSGGFFLYKSYVIENDIQNPESTSRPSDQLLAKEVHTKKIFASVGFTDVTTLIVREKEFPGSDPISLLVFAYKPQVL
ncbi:hypothetical protein [Candidatus Nucleicultrix amoebiphila]|jgi:hypothetical protein|uniref:Methyltransferase type 11 domain-containing protein n=1 Tax=Candidatus Nucleicultrix amoebiphila FS5 TaxID=1414854 RepID=A0A1W6N3A6_9PROT|nr:hypothetical protein [Candidatus Nucleicultrix amoebiphila]ARN84360.1 hypothetical protein GQ61_02360 [Candidatus Nucleicultrix amoebiphila FS5]